MSGSSRSIAAMPDSQPSASPTTSIQSAVDSIAVEPATRHLVVVDEQDAARWVIRSLQSGPAATASAARPRPRDRALVPGWPLGRAAAAFVAVLRPTPERVVGRPAR